MTITLNIQNEQLFDKVLWLLNHLKSDGLEIIANRTKKSNSTEPTLTPQAKELPSGFLNPIKIDSYSDIASRDELYER